MDLRKLRPDTSSKVSFFLIVIIMTIFGFIQDYIFSSEDLPSLGNLFLLFFTVFACLLYLSYRFKIYKDFYALEVTEIIDTKKTLFLMFIYLLVLASIPNILIFYLGTIVGGVILILIVLLYTLILGAEIIKYKTLIQRLIDTKILHYNTIDDIKIRKFVSDNKYKLSKKEMIIKLRLYDYDIDRIIIIVYLMCDPIPVI